MSEGWLLPPVTELNEPFWAGARAGELRIPRCRDTGRFVFPPRPMSPWGGHREPEWVTVSGRGRVWSWCRPHPPLLPAYADVAPYLVVLVAIEEDPCVRLIGNLVREAGAPFHEIQEVAIGQPVQVVFEPTTPEIHLPRWRPE